mgnify:FL=1|tara:strand:+ start:1581 stop:2201 length:621 start_codon:yes stop_codon:yes gene_type:complete
MTKSITTSLPDNDYAHSLYVPGVKRAYIQYDPELQTLHADYSEDDSVLADVRDGEVVQWPIEVNRTREQIQDGLDTIKNALESNQVTPEQITEIANGSTMQKASTDIGRVFDYYDSLDYNGGVAQAYDWVVADDWIGGQSIDDFFGGLLDDTDNKLREWFGDGDLKQEDDEGNRHVHHDTETTTIIGLLDYWRDRVDEYRAEKATV